MKFLWICLHDTFLKRKTITASTVDVDVEIIGKNYVNGKNAVPAVVEGKDLTNDLIDFAISNNAAIFIENFVIDTISIQTIKFLAVKGIPFFWEIDDVFHYLRFLGRISNNNVTYADLLDELIKLESSFHSINVSELSFQIAERLYCPADISYLIRSAALLHDIGKLLMPRSFVTAPRWYTNIEKEYMKLHCLYGISLLKKVNGDNFIFDEISKEVIINHHERINGTGYPYGKRGDEIPLAAKIVAVVDVYDALRTNRPYRSACDHDLAITYLKGKSSTFDNKIVKVLEEVVHENNDLWNKDQRRSNEFSIRGS